MRRYKARAIRIVAEDDIVVVEARGEVMTKSGKPYDQAYCYVFELADEEVREAHRVPRHGPRNPGARDAGRRLALEPVPSRRYGRLQSRRPVGGDTRS